MVLRSTVSVTDPKTPNANLEEPENPVRRSTVRNSRTQKRLRCPSQDENAVAGSHGGGGGRPQGHHLRCSPSGRSSTSAPSPPLGPWCPPPGRLRNCGPQPNCKPCQSHAEATTHRSDFSPVPERPPALPRPPSPPHLPHARLPSWRRLHLFRPEVLIMRVTVALEQGLRSISRELGSLGKLKSEGLWPRECENRAVAAHLPARTARVAARGPFDLLTRSSQTDADMQWRPVTLSPPASRGAMAPSVFREKPATDAERACFYESGSETECASWERPWGPFPRRLVVGLAGLLKPGPQGGVLGEGKWRDGGSPGVSGAGGWEKARPLKCGA